MATKKNNVFLKIKDSKNGPHFHSCGHMSLKDINKLYSELYNILSVYGVKQLNGKCAHIESAKITTTNIKSFKGNHPNTSYELEIILNNPRPHVPCCDVLHPKWDCLNCIAEGKCQDEMIIKLLGKKLFAEKYQGK